VDPIKEGNKNNTDIPNSFPSVKWLFLPGAGVSKGTGRSQGE